MSGKPAGDPTCYLVWFDPGGVTGWATVGIRSSWLLGAGSATWGGPGVASRGSGADLAGGLKGALAHVSYGQIGSGTIGAEMLGDVELGNIYHCYEILKAWPDAAWGYEDFIPGSANMGRDFLSPVRYFSALVFADYVHGMDEYGHPFRRPFRQNAAAAKSSATDERMKMAGLYIPGSPHATDALRHAATFFRRCRVNRALRESAWPDVFA